MPVATQAGPEGSGYSGGTSGIAEREIARRQQKILEAAELIAKGDQAKADGDLETAIQNYRSAIDLLPDAPFTRAQRDEAIQKFADTTVEYARQRAESGDTAGAKVMVEQVLSDAIAPDHKEAKILLQELDDPEVFNPANTPEHSAKVQEVEKGLRMGMGYYDLGDYDKAREQFHKVLAKDKYNTAARRQLEKLERRIMEYQKSARDHTRAAMLREVDEMWETYVPKTGLERFANTSTTVVNEDKGVTAINEKLRSIIIPLVSFQDATIQEAVDFLRLKSKELDPYETDPAEKGVNIVVQDAGEAANAARITLSLTQVPLGEALKYVTDLAGMRYKVDAFAVRVVPSTYIGTEMYNRTFRVPPDFISSGGSGDAAVDSDPFGDPGGATTTLPTKKSAREVLEEKGVPFPPESSAYFIASTSQLVVRNTQQNLETIEAIVEEMFKGVQRQIFVTTKFVEVTQDSTEEFGFDWLLGQFNLPTTERAFASGGTVGNSPAGAVSNLDYPFTPPSGTGEPIPTGGFPLTRGLRSGSFAIQGNAIDALLSSTQVVSGVAPGIFSVAGVFSDPQFQVVLRALSQNKGTDLMTAPSIATRSGQRAKIEVIREFIYPIEFDPPEIPQEFGSIGGGGQFFDPTTGLIGNPSVSSFPVTPTTPTAFETRNTGVTLEVDPVIGSDGFTIDLNLAPEVVEFEGFVNYGSPIQSAAINALGQPTTVILTENKIEQPIFATRKVSTAVTVWDGQTVGIGGLMREDAQMVEDKVPILGDIPFLGRLFRVDAEQHFKRNLMIFVTAKLIDPAGQTIRQPDDKAEPDVAPSTLPSGANSPLIEQDPGIGAGDDIFGGGADTMPADGGAEPAGGGAPPADDPFGF